MTTVDSTPLGSGQNNTQCRFMKFKSFCHFKKEMCSVLLSGCLDNNPFHLWTLNTGFLGRGGGSETCYPAREWACCKPHTKGVFILWETSFWRWLFFIFPVLLPDSLIPQHGEVHEGGPVSVAVKLGRSRWAEGVRSHCPPSTLTPSCRPSIRWLGPLPLPPARRTHTQESPVVFLSERWQQDFQFEALRGLRDGTILTSVHFLSLAPGRSLSLLHPKCHPSNGGSSSSLMPGSFSGSLLRWVGSPVTEFPCTISGSKFSKVIKFKFGVIE